MKFQPHIVGLGGTLRAGSASEMAMRAALTAAANAGARTTAFTGMDLSFPLYMAGGTERIEKVLRFLMSLRRCDGVIIASPSYHGTISGLLKNALDYIEDLRSDQRPYLDGLPIGCAVCAAGSQAAGQTLSTLRTIAHSLRAWPTPFVVTLDTSDTIFDEEGTCLRPQYARQLSELGEQVVKFAGIYARQIG